MVVGHAPSSSFKPNPHQVRWLLLVLGTIGFGADPLRAGLIQALGLGNRMYWFTKILFAIADFLARLLLAFSVIAVVALPFVGPVYARMASQQNTTLSILGHCLMWLAVAVGAYAITRRHVLGLALLMVPAIASFVGGQFAVGLVVTTAVAMVFAMPFLLAYLQARSASASGPAA